MTPALSADTQAILLLTAPLISGRGASAAELLPPRDYQRLARHLRELQSRPADLVAPDAGPLIRACAAVVDEVRLQRLLSRGFLLSQVIERWTTRAIWVLSRADSDYPRRLKQHLREDAPAVIYGCGDPALLASGGLAVVGSRKVDEALIDYTLAVGRLAAEAGRTVISGGARGIDQAAMRGALEAGGKASGVLADTLENAAMARENRKALLEGRLVLISPYDPSAAFNVGHAMQRNKLIYALADAALVVNADLGKGGTWTGAMEQLDRLRFVPLFVRASGAPSPGLDALGSKGAWPWPEPEDAEGLEAVFSRAAAGHGSTCGTITGSAVEKPRSVALGQLEETRPPYLPVTTNSEAPVAEPSTPPPASPPAEQLFATVRSLIATLLATPKKDTEVATALAVSPGQAKAWLQRLVDEGVIEKRSRPAEYVVKGVDLLG